MSIRRKMRGAPIRSIPALHPCHGRARPDANTESEPGVCQGGGESPRLCHCNTTQGRRKDKKKIKIKTRKENTPVPSRSPFPFPTLLKFHTNFSSGHHTPVPSNAAGTSSPLAPKARGHTLRSVPGQHTHTHTVSFKVLWHGSSSGTTAYLLLPHPSSAPARARSAELRAVQHRTSSYLQSAHNETV